MLARLEASPILGVEDETSTVKGCGSMACTLETKSGRPRQYRFTGVPSFVSSEAGLAASALDELRERVIDQIEDLPQAALSFVPERLTFSISSLVIHMVWAEMGWIERLANVTAPSAWHELLDAGGRAIATGTNVVVDLDADALIALCRQVRAELTVPSLAKVANLDAAINDEGGSATPRGILMHVIWHWTYHSGQVGLLRELWGAKYRWTFGSLGR